MDSIVEIEKPSLLDLYNMEEIHKLFPESIKYLLKILLTNYHSNKTLMLIYNKFEDINFIINLIVNYFTLNKTDSTFLGNNFNISYKYSYKYLDRSDYIFFILFDNYGIDYIFHKLDLYKESLVNEYKLIKKNYKMELIKDNGRFWEDNIDDFKKKLVQKIKLKKYNIMFKIYPIIKKYYKIIKFVVKICYYKNFTDSYTPLQTLLNIKMIRSSNNSYLSSKIFVFILTSLRAIDYYNRENLLSSILTRDKDLVDNAPLPRENPSLKNCKIKQNKCPLCFNKYKEPTCLEENGLIFCYDCIYNNLEYQRNNNAEKLVCPITKLKLRHGFNSLIKLRL